MRRFASLTSRRGDSGARSDRQPQRVYKGKKLKERNRILKDAKLLEEAGIFSVVLECIETKLAKKISDQLNIITVGIGSSSNCDGQVLVIDDLIGLSQSKFRFVKKYANINRTINHAVKKYRFEVLKKQFPRPKHSFKN